MAEPQQITAPYLDEKGQFATPSVLAQIDARARAAVEALNLGAVDNGDGTLTIGD